MRLVTVSASYGAGGSRIAPAVAERIGVPFLDRAVPARDDALDEVGEGAATEEDVSRGVWARVLDALATVPDEFGTRAPELGGDRAVTVRAEAERRLRALADAGTGGVVLGWAAALVLPEAVRIRFDGPVAARIRRGMEIEGVDADTARRRLERTDEIRRLYWRRLYRQDWRDPDHYHLVLDTTVLDLEAATALVVAAVNAIEPVAPTS